MTYAKLRATLMNFTEIMIDKSHVVNNHFVSKANQGLRPQPNTITLASKIRDFIRMNPQTFHGSKVEKHPYGFIDKVVKVVDYMGVTPCDKAELATYQLKGEAQVWYEQWRSERPLESELVDWEEVKEDFLDRFFTLGWIEKNMVEFMNLCQAGMSVQEYSLKFTQLSKYDPFI